MKLIYNLWLNTSTVNIGWSDVCSDVFENHIHLAVCVDMHCETPSIPTPLLTNFADYAYTLPSWYDYFYIAITVVNFISIYQYIGISRTSLTLGLLSLIIFLQVIVCTAAFKFFWIIKHKILHTRSYVYKFNS